MSELRVVKIGGSLLDLPDLPGRLRRWRSMREGIDDVFVVGGGRAADLLRARDDLSEEEAHWKAIEAMDANARHLAEKMGELYKGNWVAVKEFMQQPSTNLPIGWQITSDSIAARLAIVLDADKLELLKWRLPREEEASSIEKLAETGYVDEFFPQLAAELPPVVCWEFRADPPKSTEPNPLRGTRDHLW